MSQPSDEVVDTNVQSGQTAPPAPINVSNEMPPASPEQSAAQAAPPITAIPQPVPVGQVQNANDNQNVDVPKTTNNSAPKILEDSDLIEKEWVDKAKRIVERNRDDPYKQSEELTEVRADYMKKVYNKTIKIDK